MAKSLRHENFLTRDCRGPTPWKTPRREIKAGEKRRGSLPGRLLNSVQWLSWRFTTRCSMAVNMVSVELKLGHV